MIEPQNGGVQPVPAFHRHKDARVLIIEDEKLVAWDMEQTLREAGLSKIEAVITLAAARQILAREPSISLVLLDLKLPDGDSSELVQELRGQAIPVAIVTGYTPFVIEGIPVLYKPFSAEDLIKVVATALDGI